MLPSSHRLPKEAIDGVVRYGARVTTDALTLRYKKKTGAARFAFIVSTKVDKRATQRNRIRRTVSESVGHLLTKISPLDGTITIRRNIAPLSQQNVELLVVALFKKAHML